LNEIRRDAIGRASILSAALRMGVIPLLGNRVVVVVGIVPRI